MAKKNQKSPQNIQINENVKFTYWNQNEWEFTIDPRNIDEKKANRYQAHAVELTMHFCGNPIPATQLNSFIEMSKQVFAL